MFHRALQVFTGITVGLAVAAVYLTLRPPSDPVPAAASGVLHFEPYTAPELALEDTRGNPVSVDDFRGEVTLVFFGFANCPDVCPLTLAHWSRALEILEPEGRSFRGLFVSIDPDRDTPEALERYMTAFDPSLLALTGSPGVLDRTAAAWGVHVAIGAGAGGGHEDHLRHDPPEAGEPAGAHAAHAPQAPGAPSYEVVHSGSTFVVDRAGRVVAMLAPFTLPDEIVSSLAPWL